jgi:photosystem II stability/assembly factor-like uncharacterized protein
MSLPQPPSTSHTSEVQERPKTAHGTRFIRISIVALLLLAVVASWQLLNSRANSTDPAAAGRPLSNSHMHLHVLAWGGQSNVLYLGTHFGLFKSTDGGRSWPQPRGVLNTMMITSIAVSPSNPNVLAVIAIPVSGIGQAWGVYFSTDGGNSFHADSPAGLPSSAYPYSVRAGSAGAGHFYAFYVYAGLFETRDMGAHWKHITSGALSNILTPSLLTDPTSPDHLLLGGDQGLFESRDDGAHWNQVSGVKGDVTSLVASNTTPRTIFCATDQGMYRWQNGSAPLADRGSGLPAGQPLSRLSINPAGSIVYVVAGQDLWYSVDSGRTWTRRWHFDRGDIISLVMDPTNPDHLYAGFFLPPKVLYSLDGGSSWQTLTD